MSIYHCTMPRVCLKDSSLVTVGKDSSLVTAEPAVSALSFILPLQFNVAQIAFVVIFLVYALFIRFMHI